MMEGSGGTTEHHMQPNGQPQQRSTRHDGSPAIALDHLPLPTAVMRRETLELLEVNSPFAELFGTRPDVLHGRSVAELLPVGEGRMIAAAAPRVDAGPDGFDVTFRIGHDELSGRLTLGPYPDAPELLILMFEDLSAERAQAAEHRRVHERVASVTRQVGHDLRSTLTVIAGFARLLASSDHDMDTDERRRIEQRLADAATRSVELATDLVAAEQRGEQERGATRLSDIVGWVEGLTALAFDAIDGMLVSDIGDEVVDVDDGVLRQILLNLVNNALEHAQPNGPLRVHIATRRLHGNLELLVTDNGRGIPLDSLDDVFRHGVQLRARGAGRGTGLATCRTIAEEVGGWLSAVPYDDGARFVLWLPARS